MRLDDATRALRDETSAPSDRAEETRSRVVAKLEQSRRRRSKRLFVILPMAAVLAGATASAGVAGKLPSALHSALRVLRLSSPPADATEPASAPAPAPAPAQTPSEAPEPSADPVPVAVVAPRPSVKSPRTISPTATATATATPTPTTTTTTTSEPAAPDSLALYRIAHRLHFSGHDPAAALSAWDAYLREDPAGSLALEARYNRAICLVRLGRSRDARDALAPFADGRLGGYRKREARALLEMLDGEAPAP